MFDKTIQVGMCAAPAGLGNVSSCVGESREAFLGSVSPLLFFFFLSFPDLESLRQVSFVCLTNGRSRKMSCTLPDRRSNHDSVQEPQ